MDGIYPGKVMQSKHIKPGKKTPVKRCKCGCGIIIQGHPNKKFFNQRHKDKYWNRKNPRGFFAPRDTDNMTDEEYFNTTEHPFCSESLGQD